MPEPERIPYSAIVDRPTLEWPDGAKIAVWVAPNLEHYEYLPAAKGVRDPYPRMPHPDVLGYGTREYGNRVGFRRFLEVVDRFEITCSAVVNTAALSLYPEVLRASEERSWEFIGHGRFNTRYHWGLSEAEERAEIHAAMFEMERLTGKRFRGWFSPALSHTFHTADLIAELGFEYWCDLAHDDQPFPMKTRHGWMLTVPYSLHVNDGVMLARGRDGEWITRTITDTFDTLYHEGGRVMCIAVHPYIIGQPHRIGHLEEGLAHIADHPDVWFTTAGAIADWYQANYWDSVIADLGSEAE